MPFVPFENVAQVELFYRQDGQNLENVLNFSTPTTPDVTLLTDLADDVINWWDTVMQPLVASTVQLIAVKATSLESDTAPAVESVTGLPLTGSVSGGSPPNNVTVVAKLLTNNRGRSYRGRIYHVGLALSQISGNLISSTPRTALLAAYGALLVPAGFGGCVLVVASRVSEGEPRTFGVATEVSGITINATLDSQRRRLPERGM